MNPLVIIPTYNERENIGPLIQAVLEIDQRIHVLVVDDNSPDGTHQVVQEVAKTNPRVHLLLRSEKAGLGKAYIAGFTWGLNLDFDTFIEMDADFSHRPVDLLKLLEALEQVDFVVGSRWVSGGGTINWGWWRRLISKGGSLYSRWILGYPISDWTGGFNGWRRSVLEGISLPTIQSEGYSFQIELKYRAMKSQFSHQEVPIIFEERRVGQSKMSTRIVIEALFRVWSIR